MGLNNYSYQHNLMSLAQQYSKFTDKKIYSQRIDVDSDLNS